MKQMPDKYIIVTDPPFNVGYHYDKYNDKIPELNYYRMLSQLIKDRPSVVIHYAEHLHNISIKLGYAPKKVVSWVYNSNTPKQHRQIAFYNVKPNFTKVGQPYKNPTDKRIAKRIAEGKTAKLYDWWNINQVKNVSNEKTSHPCQMPLKVMERIIGILPDDMLIVDPFSGSGTTAVACEKMGRNYIGIEISPEYCEIARKRVQEAKDSMGLFND
jgi:site-specific DNA-methyltransferase (adenine-specific)